MVNYDAFKGKERPLPCMATSCFSPPLLESGGLEEGEREQDLTVRQKAICFFSPSCLALTPARGVRAVASSKRGLSPPPLLSHLLESLELAQGMRGRWVQTQHEGS